VTPVFKSKITVKPFVTCVRFSEVGGIVIWNETHVERRVHALNALARIPPQQALGQSLARALARSLTDAASEVVVAASRAVSHWSNAFCKMGQEFCELLCGELLTALGYASTAAARAHIVRAIAAFAEDGIGSNALVAVLGRQTKNGLCARVAGGACDAVLRALNCASSKVLKMNMLKALRCLFMCDEGRRALVAAQACEALVHSLVSAETQDAKVYISTMIVGFAGDMDVRLALVAAGAGRALAQGNFCFWAPDVRRRRS
jgi:hypothetical protein